jgi:hypothetical protein
MRDLDNLTRASLHLKLIEDNIFASWISLKMKRGDGDLSWNRFGERTLSQATEWGLDLIVNIELMGVDEVLHHSFNVTIIVCKFE